MTADPTHPKMTDKAMIEADYDEAVAVQCPACGAHPGLSCSYVEGAEHNGWLHVERYLTALTKESSHVQG